MEDHRRAQILTLNDRAAQDRRRMEDAQTDEARAVWRAMLNLSQNALAMAVQKAGRVSCL